MVIYHLERSPRALQIIRPADTISFCKAITKNAHKMVVKVRELTNAYYTTQFTLATIDSQNVTVACLFDKNHALVYVLINAHQIALCLGQNVDLCTLGGSYYFGFDSAIVGAICRFL